MCVQVERALQSPLALTLSGWLQYDETALRILIASPLPGTILTLDQTAAGRQLVGAETRTSPFACQSIRY